MKNNIILDSGCSQTVCSNKNLFYKYVKLDKIVRYVKVADGTKHRVIGIGNISIKSIINKRERYLNIKNVLHVPKINGLLISMSQILENYEVKHDKNDHSIMHENVIIATAETRRGIIVLTNVCSFNTNNTACYNTHTTKQNNKNILWHRRFNHLNYNYIKKLKTNNTNNKNFDFNVKIDNPLCSECIRGKQVEKHFKISSSRATKPFDLIHTDVCQSSSPSVSNKKYFITFLDDHTSFLWTVPIEHKSDVTSVIKNFVRSVKNRFGKNIKTIRSDKGGEYINHVLNTFFAKRGITHQTSATYTPQQNGRAERVNLTLLNAIRTVLTDSTAPKIYWAEALNCVTYTKNRSPAKSNNYLTPFEMLHDRQPDYTRLKPFGCIGYALTKPRKDKLEPKSKPLMFVGYSSSSKAFRMLNPATNNIIETDSVVFDEQTLFLQKKNVDPSTETNNKDSEENKTEAQKEEESDNHHSENENFENQPTNTTDLESNTNDDDEVKQERAKPELSDLNTDPSSDQRPPPFIDKKQGFRKYLPKSGISDLNADSSSDQRPPPFIDKKQGFNLNTDPSSDQRPPPFIDKKQGFRKYLPKMITRSGRESKNPDKYGDWTKSVSPTNQIKCVHKSH